MNNLTNLLIGYLVGLGIYLLMNRSILKWVFGLSILSAAINMMIISVGNTDPRIAPFVDKIQVLATEQFANPLAQALVLTAIVISFGIVSFSLITLSRVWHDYQSNDSDKVLD